MADLVGVVPGSKLLRRYKIQSPMRLRVFAIFESLFVALLIFFLLFSMADIVFRSWVQQTYLKNALSETQNQTPISLSKNPLVKKSFIEEAGFIDIDLLSSSTLYEWIHRMYLRMEMRKRFYRILLNETEQHE